ncbi:phosphatases II [Violaceomyces palustris]|uniref:Phosphatases II n=1 Tax=Violaceomyces palustris TaxID=1673888 RepID=A0ACD0NVP0_9BASI|nr:phosphatases II [Violaceomyces palustris]
MSGMEWRYEMRRDCQEIIPGLYLGPLESSKSLTKLQSLGITSVLILRAPHEEPFLRPRFPEELTYLILQVEDKEVENLIRIYPSVRGFLLSEMAKGGKVLVHDDGGISRAPAVVVMFIMEQRRMTYESAMAFVQSRRYCMHMNQGFVWQVKEFESIYNAEQTQSQMTIMGMATTKAAGMSNKGKGRAVASTSSSTAPNHPNLNQQAGDEMTIDSDILSHLDDDDEQDDSIAGRRSKKRRKKRRLSSSSSNGSSFERDMEIEDSTRRTGPSASP